MLKLIHKVPRSWASEGERKTLQVMKTTDISFIQVLNKHELGILPGEEL